MEPIMNYSRTIEGIFYKVLINELFFLFISIKLIPNKRKKNLAL